jgi:hypothetical protein
MQQIDEIAQPEHRSLESIYAVHIIALSRLRLSLFGRNVLVFTQLRPRIPPDVVNLLIQLPIAFRTGEPDAPVIFTTKDVVRSWRELLPAYQVLCPQGDGR